MSVVRNNDKGPHCLRPSAWHPASRRSQRELRDLHRGLLATLVTFVSFLGCSSPQAESAVVVVVDTLRADHLGAYGYELRPTSPEIDEWASGATVYRYAFAPAPWTLPSVASLLTSRLPTEHGAGIPIETTDANGSVRKERFQRLDDRLPTLASFLAEQGLATGAFINNTFLHPRFGLDKGFGVYDYVAGTRQRIRRADDVIDLALDWIEEHQGQRFFLLVHLFDPHMNYDAPEPFAGRFSGVVSDTGLPRPTDLKEVRARLRAGEPVDFTFLEATYDEEIAFIDEQMGRFLEGLGGLRESTLVVLTSDHGEEFNDHGGFEHGHTVYNELLRVPLIASGPGFNQKIVDAPVSLLDVAPTVVQALGFDAAASFTGAALQGTGLALAQRMLVAERTLYGPEEQALVRWPFKLHREPGRERRRLFSLAEDFGEREDLAVREPDRVRRMAGSLEQILMALDEAAGGDAELDDETLEHLRSLGYIQ